MTRDIRSRDGQWIYHTDTTGTIVTSVTHRPTGETLRMRESLARVRARAASGSLLATVQRVAFDRANARVSQLGQHIGREIQHDGTWHRVVACSGGPHPLVNVFVAGHNEPLRLPHDQYVPVRDPEPAVYTVVSVRWPGGSEPIPVAAVPDSVPVLGDMNDGERVVAVVTAPTADKAMNAARTAPPVPATAEVPTAQWTVIGVTSIGDCWPSYTPVCALPGVHEVQGRYDLDHREVRVVDAESANAAIERVCAMHAAAESAAWD